MPVSRLLVASALCGAAACATAPPVAEAPPRAEAGLGAEELRSAWEDARRSEDFERAVALRQRLAALDPDDGARRLAVAAGLREVGHAATALALCVDLGDDPAVGGQARELEAALLAELGRPLEAAQRLEALAVEADDDARARALWEHAARLREDGGDLAGAVLALEQAFAGMELRPSEQRLLDRLRAYQTGVYRHPGDAAEVLRGHEDARLRRGAARYLAGLGGEVALAALTGALDDADVEVVLLAVDGLAAHGDALVLPELAEALDHADARVRLAATRAYAAMAADAGRAAAGPLVGRLDPSDRALFRAQCQALESLTGHVEAAPLNLDEDSRAALAEAWRAWWNGRR